MAAQVRSAWPCTKVQLEAWQATATAGLLTVKPMEHLAASVVHCTSRLPGSSRPPSRSAGGRVHAYDLRAEPGAKAREVLQVAAAARVLRTQAASLWHSAQPGPVKPSGQVTATGVGRG